MKKFFILIAFLFAAMSANAQTVTTQWGTMYGTIAKADSALVGVYWYGYSANDTNVVAATTTIYAGRKTAGTRMPVTPTMQKDLLLMEENKRRVVDAALTASLATKLGITQAANTYATTASVDTAKANIRQETSNNINYGQPIIGEVKMFAGANVPQYHLLADGRMLKKTDYPVLYSTISGQFGENTDSFRLPNLTDKFVRGGTNRGQTGGSDSLTLTVDNMPAHSHDVSVTVNAGSGGNLIGTATGNLLASQARGGVTPPTVYTDATTPTPLGAGAAAATATATGGGTAFSILPSYIILSYIIRVQ